MRIATWNINGLRARMEFMAVWLINRQPDVVGLQELKTPTEEFPHDFFADLGYHALVHGQKSWNGVAILTRSPCQLLQTGLPGEDDWGSRLLTADVGGLQFTTVYCPNGKSVEHDDYPKKLIWYESLRKHWSSDNHAKRVLCGDFNIVPAPIDSWRREKADGDVFHTVAERSCLQDLLASGLTDLCRHLKPEEQGFSWWDYRGGAFHRKQGLRIDFILGSDSVRDLVDDVVIDRDYRKKQDGLTASDHAPVYADLKI